MATLINQSLFLDDLICNYCSNPDSMRYDYKDGNILCISCGFIAHKRFIDFKAEYRIFSEDNDGTDPRRTAGCYNENLEDGGLGTCLEKIGDKKFQFRTCNNPSNAKYYDAINKLKNWANMLSLNLKTVNLAFENYERLLMKKKTILMNYWLRFCL